MLYKTLVRPILEYCSTIWFPLHKQEALEIEKVQRRATKLVPGLRNLDYSDRLKQLNIPTLYYRRKRTDMLQVYRLLRGIDKIDYNQFFTLSQNSTRGHEWKLEKPRAVSSIRANSFSNRVINDWNNLDSSVVNAGDINAFKTALESHWADDPNKWNFE